MTGDITGNISQKVILIGCTDDMIEYVWCKKCGTINKIYINFDYLCLNCASFLPITVTNAH